MAGALLLLWCWWLVVVVIWGWCTHLWQQGWVQSEWCGNMEGAWWQRRQERLVLCHDRVRLRVPAMRWHWQKWLCCDMSNEWMEVVWMRGNDGKERRREGISMGVKDGGDWVEAVCCCLISWSQLIVTSDRFQFELVRVGSKTDLRSCDQSQSVPVVGNRETAVTGWHVYTVGETDT